MPNKIFDQTNKRILPLLGGLCLSLCLGLLTVALFLPVATADDQSDQFLTPDPVMTEQAPLFNQADPYVCLIPDDDFFLPCHANLIADAIPIQASAVSSITNVPCEDGLAAGYLCNNVDLLSFLPLATFGPEMASDLWGWTDPDTGQEIVILTLRDQTAFVDATDPLNPVVLGLLPRPDTAFISAWRDVKTYQNYAYIVGDIAGEYGMQIFDLTRLRGITETETLTVDAHYTQVSATHNIVINEETGLAALVGVSQGVERCGGGMHLIDLADNPLEPAFAGCVAEDGYVHDAQCIVYDGPDLQFQGQEVCFNFNTNSIAIVDVTDRTAPIQLSRTTYTQSAYTHQGWVTPDHTFMLVDDESDETYHGINTTTLIYDISSLQAPELIGVHTADTGAIDHNQYIHLGYSYQANYRAGFRLIDTSQISSGQLSEAAYFDIFPSSDSPHFNGAWSVYPYFESGVVPISGVEQGLFLVKPTVVEEYRAIIQPSEPVAVQLGENFDKNFIVYTLGQDDTYTATVQPQGVGATLIGPQIVSGTAETPIVVPVNISVPATLSVGEYSVILELASHNRPGHVISQTLILEAETISDYAFSMEPVGLSFVSDNQLIHHFALTNLGNHSDQFEIFVDGTQSGWTFTPSITRTATLSVQEEAKFSIFADLGTEGIYSEYSLSARSVNDPAVSQTQTFTKSLDINIDANVNHFQSGLPGETVTYTIEVVNRGEAQNQFTLHLHQNVWESELTITETELLSPNDSATLQVKTMIGEGHEDVLGVRIDSSRIAPHAYLFFYTKTYRQFSPYVAR